LTACICGVYEAHERVMIERIEAGAPMSECLLDYMAKALEECKAQELIVGAKEEVYAVDLCEYLKVNLISNIQLEIRTIHKMALDAW